MQMLGFNQATDQLAMVNSAWWYVHVMRMENEGQSNKKMLKGNRRGK